MNNVFDGVFTMKIRKRVLEFLNETDVQDALAWNDTQELYKLAADASRQGDLSLRDIGELTSILMQAGINPLEGMTEIPVYFLYEQEGIKSFNIPRGITKIGVSAFEHTDLESITIPNSVKVISTGAFRSCAGLKTVKLPAGVELHVSAFSSSGLESIELKDVKLQDYLIFWSCKQLKSVIIKGDTPVIPARTFANCYKLTHVELPETVKQIGPDVFNECDKLRKIDFAGTTGQWKNIEIDKDNRKLFICKIICSDGTLKYDSDVEEWK